MLLKKILKKNVIFNSIRNSFVSFPSPYISPKVQKTSISDFFFYKNNNSFQSKLMLFNLSSHVLPEIIQDEIVKLFFFNKKGSLVKKYELTLGYQETKEILISDFSNEEYGSFFAFHIFKNFGDLLQNNAYISERGYMAYSCKNSIWSFMHGNHNAAYLDDKFQIYSVLGKSFRENNPYLPQVSFLDQDEFDIVINNPSNKLNSLLVTFKDEKHDTVDNKKIYIYPYGTHIINCKKKIYSLELNSKQVLNRPIIIKYYKDSFDIFHG